VSDGGEVVHRGPSRGGGCGRDTLGMMPAVCASACGAKYVLQVFIGTLIGPLVGHPAADGDLQVRLCRIRYLVVRATRMPHASAQAAGRCMVAGTRVQIA
jgi:hypothetical protein